MKKLLISLTMIAISLSATAQNQVSWVYLNNGNIVSGMVTKTESTVEIITDDGETLKYPLIEVTKITTKAPVRPKVGVDPDLKEWSSADKGFWISVQELGSYTLFLSRHGSAWEETNVEGGYRFGQYLKIGLGIGARYYFNNEKLRKRSKELSFPIYLTARGNIIAEAYRTVVPYYGISLGASIQDGFMWRPAIGLRIGQSRSAFLLAINYTGQNLKYHTGKNRYVSSIGLSVGYEF